MEQYKIDQTRAYDATVSGHFDGQVWAQRLITEQHGSDIEVLVVSFEPGGRARPHIHPVDQVLFVVSGQGIVANATERRHVGPGDVIRVPAGEWHWYGATPDEPMTHISVKRPAETDWNVDQGDWAELYF